MLFVTLLFACRAGHAYGISALPRLESIISCPGMVKTGPSEYKCEDLPVRYQAVISVAALRNVGITECDNYDYSKAESHYSCTTDEGACYDNRDCCSNYCSWSTYDPKNPQGRCAVPFRMLRPQTRRLPHDDRDPSKKCSGNSECVSYRCVNGYCNDDVNEGFAGSDGCYVPGLTIMYTIQLEGESSPGVPSVNNTENTFHLMPGEFGDILFPGKTVLRSRLRYCGSFNNYACIDGAIYETKIKVNKQKDTHNAARPPKNSDSIYVRSAISFDTFGQSASRFNSSAFKSAVVDALNIDRLIYSPGQSDGKQEFAQVKEKDVVVIEVNPKSQVVTFEVRTKREDHAIHLSARMLHAYFKFPLAIFLSKYGVLDNQAYSLSWEQAKRISVAASDAVLLRAEMFKGLSIAVGLAAGVVVLIVVSGMLVCAGAVWIFVRAREQAKVATMLSYKAESLNKREKELAKSLELLEKKKNELLRETAELKRAAEKHANDYAEAQKRLKLLAAKESSEIEALNSSLDEEHKNEVENIKKQLEEEKKEVIKALADNEEIALDADSVEHRMEDLFIKGGSSSAEVQKALDERHAKIRSRAQHRNEQRRAAIERRLEQEAALTLARLDTARVQQEELDIRVGDIVLSSKQNAETLKDMLEKRKNQILERTVNRNKKRKTEIDRKLQEETNMVLSKVCDGNQSDIKLPAVAFADSELLSDEDLHEENKILESEVYAKIDSILLKSSMAKDELAAQLAKRKKILLARTRARNEHRKHMLVKAKRQEQVEKMTEDAKKASRDVHRLHDLVKMSQIRLHTNESKVKHLEAEAEEHRRELEAEQKARQNEKRAKLQQRLAQKKKRKQLKQTSTK